jgi:hypothetical protein
MRVFLLALLATFVFSVGAIVALSAAQRTAATAYTTDGARTNPGYSWRRLVKKDQVKAGARAATGVRVDPASMQQDEVAEACETSGALKWLFVDFSDAADEAGCNA